ncbi:TIGR03571 family LLM class oxidoreductase [Pseudomonas sp. SAS7]|jgi:luciferase-type oxidoreductase|uniref:TIGR03571 family LLM class oxidoreductase n=1 Tax=Pseudomonas TaxID=286 RepID=UPI00216407DC|nr:TIGR03571 family LLM class oxidoreductase [Pseudomonas putida]
MNPTLHKLAPGGLSIGLELPLDNDWNRVREQARQRAGTPFGVPDLADHARLATLADRLGFRALWVRDVPLYDPQFGDAAQVFEVFTYLGFLAGVTSNILLGTAAVVLPIREPLLTMKAAASVDLLSGGRLLLGVASGDRPVEYPLFGRDFDSRGEAFRKHITLLREWRSNDLPAGVEVLPRPRHALPLLVAGLAQQSPAWVGEHLDGWLAYPGTPAEHVHRAGVWREVAGDKPYVSFIHLDLDENPEAPLQRHRFGCKVGRQGLIAELEAMRAAGVAHIGLHLRHNRRPLDETLEELGAFVLPHFHG